VTWTQGPVRCGSTTSGKPRFHDSEVAAIAWCIQQMLHQRGFLNEFGRPYPLTDLVRRNGDRQQTTVTTVTTIATDLAKDASKSAKSPSPLAVIGECPDADCRGDMLLIDNCPTCICCGYSKCG
jgi:ribonucleoside-diphosphate reductase alpha chain